METRDKIVFNKILTSVVEHRASDLHLLVGSAPVLRIDNDVKPLSGQPVITRDFIEGIIFSFLSAEQKEQLKKEKTLTFSYDFGSNLRFRINIFYQKGNLGASLRYVPQAIKSLKDLGLPALVEDLTKSPKGFLIITGPLGSGKTTTVASLIETINSNDSKYIITLEDPAEYIFVNKKSVIEQREVGRDVPSLIAGLEFLKDEDVDIVVLPNLEEPDMIYKALVLAEAGHLVIAQMNVSAVYRATERIDNLFAEDKKELVRIMLAENLVGIVSQRLLPRIGGGLILVSEVLKANPAVKTSIREGKFYQVNSIMQTAQAEGMVSLDRSLAELVKTGEISLKDALDQAIEPMSVKSMAA